MATTKRRIQLTPPSIRQKKKRQTRFKVGFIAMGVVLVVIAIIYTLRLPSLAITSIRSEGNEFVTNDEISAVVKKSISGYYFYIFPKRNFLLLPHYQVKKDLGHEFERFSSITISIEKINTLVVKVVERKGKYLWCGTSFSPGVLGSDQSCYFADDHGYIFASAPYFSGNVYLKVYGGSTAPDTAVGTSIVSSDLFQKILIAKEGLEALGLVPEVVLITLPNTYEIYLERFSEGDTTPARIIFDFGTDPRIQIANLKTALTSEAFKAKFDAQKDKLEYIDLRYQNKVYYKFTK